MKIPFFLESLEQLDWAKQLVNKKNLNPFCCFKKIILVMQRDSWKSLIKINNFPFSSGQLFAFQSIHVFPLT